MDTFLYSRDDIIDFWRKNKNFNKIGFLYWDKNQHVLPLPNINKKQSEVEKWTKREKQNYKAIGKQYRKNLRTLRIRKDFLTKHKKYQS